MASVSLLDGLVPAPGWEDDVSGLVRQYHVWEDEARARHLDDAAIEDAVVGQVQATFGLRPRRARAVTRRVRDLFATTTLRADMAAEPAYAPADFARVTCPVLGIYGDRSDLFWLTVRLPGLLADLTLHTVAGADHLGVFWRLEETRPLLRRFIGLPART
jgi:pimeloyl-ACP methyl ester carboxylesterase